MLVFRLKQFLTAKTSENLASPAPRLVRTIQCGSSSSSSIVKKLWTREEGTTENQMLSWATFKRRWWIPKAEQFLGHVFSNRRRPHGRTLLWPQRNGRCPGSSCPGRGQAGCHQDSWQSLPSLLPYTQAGWILTKIVKISLKKLFVSMFCWDLFLLLLLS